MVFYFLRLILALQAGLQNGSVTTDNIIFYSALLELRKYPFVLLERWSFKLGIFLIYLINSTKKDSSLCLLQELSRNYDVRIRIEVTRTPSIRFIGGPPRSLVIGLLDIFRSKNNWNFLTSISYTGT